MKPGSNGPTMTPSTGRKTLLLTGAAGLLGSEIIRQASEQLDIIALVHRRPLQFSSTHATLFDLDENRHYAASVRVVECDLADQKSLVTCLTTITSLVGRCDYVINCAGDTRFLGSTSDAIWIADDARRQFELHVFAPSIICSVLFHLQWKNIPVSEQQVSILNVSSISGSKIFGDSGQGFYAASKAATNMLTLHMAADYGRYAIKVNALVPNRFPQIVSTDVVASNALKILSGDKSGQLFSIG